MMNSRLWLILGFLTMLGGATATAWQYRMAYLGAHSRATLAESEVSSYRDAQRITTDHLRRVQADRDRWEQTAKELEELHGVEELLNPYFRGVLDRVRASSRDSDNGP